MNDDPTVLLTPRGAEALARAEQLRAGPARRELAVAAELRREFPPDLAAAAMAQAGLREAAAAKFSRAGEMLFTRGGYEQASGEVIARHRAVRFAAARRVADLCCGIGGDLRALATAAPPAESAVLARGDDPPAAPSRGTPPDPFGVDPQCLPGGYPRTPSGSTPSAFPGDTLGPPDPDARPIAGDRTGRVDAGESPLSVRDILAVDLDPVHARLALHNAGGDGVRAVVADVRDVALTGFDAVFIDPARRLGERRFRAGVCEPPLDWCFGLADQVPAVCVKAAPGLPAELIPAGWEAEFIADGRDLKEAVLWSPAFATAARRATVLPGGTVSTPTGLTAVPGDPVAVAEPGEYLLDPSPAVTRAGLVEDLARTAGGWKIDELIAFIALDKAVSTPFGRTLRVLHSAPWHEKRFAARLRELGVGAADVRRRGLAGDVDAIRRRLKLAGPHRATLVLTRVANRPWGLICADVQRP